MKYSRKSLLGAYSYELGDTGLKVEASNLVSWSCSETFFYDGINPAPVYLRIRSAFFLRGIWTVIVGAIVYAQVAPHVSVPHLDLFSSIAIVAGLVAVLIGHRSIEVARFKSKAGVAAFDVVGRTKAPEEFETFVRSLIERIRAAQIQNDQAPVPATTSPVPPRMQP